MKKIQRMKIKCLVHSLTGILFVMCFPSPHQFPMVLSWNMMLWVNFQTFWQLSQNCLIIFDIIKERDEKKSEKSKNKKEYMWKARYGGRGEVKRKYKNQWWTEERTNQPSNHRTSTGTGGYEEKICQILTNWKQ